MSVCDISCDRNYTGFLLETLQARSANLALRWPPLSVIPLCWFWRLWPNPSATVMLERKTVTGVYMVLVGSHLIKMKLLLYSCCVHWQDYSQTVFRTLASVWKYKTWRSAGRTGCFFVSFTVCVAWTGESFSTVFMVLWSACFSLLFSSHDT